MWAWYWLFEPLTLGLSLQLPVPREVYWFAGSYPKIAAVLIVAGLLALLLRRNRNLWWFLAPVSLSAALHGVALAVGDDFAEFAVPLVLVSLGTGLALTIYAFIRSRAAWPAGLLLAADSVIILGYQGFLSIMMLTGSAI